MWARPRLDVPQNWRSADNRPPGPYPRGTGLGALGKPNMSLNFCLYDPESMTERCVCTCGHEHNVTKNRELYSANITHNFGRMAEAAGIYKCLWRPEECSPPIATAEQCIPILMSGLILLRGDPHRFRKFDAANGWGTYEQFVPWVERVLAACREYPLARVEASR